MDSLFSGQVLVTIFIFLVVFNFLPTCVAFVDRHPERRLLAGLNILALFSFALWLALMAWAVGGRRPDSMIGQWMADPRARRVVVCVAAGFAAFSLGGTLGGLGVV
jgi:uncharacterized membrane protein